MNEIRLPVYLDYNATTPVATEVLDAIIPYFREQYGNPSSSHSYGKAAKQGLDQAREQLADLLGAEPTELIFTGCATESNNLALFGMAGTAPVQKRHLIISAIEHPSVMQPVLQLQREGWEVTFAEVDQQGRIDLELFRQSLRPDTAFVSIMHANNEIGTIQPIHEISKLTRDMDIPLHVDGAQSVGKISVNVMDLGVDLLSIAGHKFYAPKGVGALYIRKGARVCPLTFGASHERGMRPGTENMALIAGLGAAAYLAKQRLKSDNLIMKLRDRFHSLLSSSIPGLTLNGHPSERLPNTLNVSFPETDANQLLRVIEGDVAASLGAACHSGGHTASDVLVAIKATQDQMAGAVRFSLGEPTTETEILHAAQAIIAGWQMLRRCSSSA
ncbi:MAG TPA: cysteine desulfurase family protein [Candidatus Angelobacter sp.]|jgi:cysteine desulfurase|nr:cysteine desulfurase family protein [Candidatus Angelobacter sp.]